MKKALVILTVLLAIAAFAGCAKPAAKADSTVVKFGVFEPLTGANAAGGAEELDGIRLAQELYPTVTVDGKEYKIELAIADNKSDKVEAANAGQRLVDSDKVQIVLGSWGCGRPDLQGRQDPGDRPVMHQPARHQGQRFLLPRMLP